MIHWSFFRQGLFFVLGILVLLALLFGVTAAVRYVDTRAEERGKVWHWGFTVAVALVAALIIFLAVGSLIRL